MYRSIPLHRSHLITAICSPNDIPQHCSSNPTAISLTKALLIQCHPRPILTREEHDREQRARATFAAPRRTAWLSFPTVLQPHFSRPHQCVHQTALRANDHPTPMLLSPHGSMAPTIAPHSYPIDSPHPIDLSIPVLVPLRDYPHLTIPIHASVNTLKSM